MIGYMNVLLKTTYGILDDAIILQKQAITLDPLSQRPIQLLGVTLRDALQLEEAEATFRRLLTLNPEYPYGHAGLAEVLILKGDPEGHRSGRNEFVNPCLDPILVHLA